MKLVIMTKPSFFVEEDKILSTLFEEGMDNLHLCKPGASPIYSERLLSLIPEDYYGKIIVHDHYYLKEEYGLGGIHIDNANEAVPKNYRGRISRTCKSLDNLKEMKRQSNYIFLGNILDNCSVPTIKANFTMNELEQASDSGLIDKKVYAYGGMSLDNAQIAKDFGFGGIVICNDLWKHFDIHNQKDYKDLIKYFELLRKTIN